MIREQKKKATFQYVLFVKHEGGSIVVWACFVVSGP